MDKIQENLELWCSAPGIKFVSKEAEEGYKKRTRRIADAIQLKEPDRVPIAPMIHFFGGRMFGLNARDTMYDHSREAEARKKTVLKFNWDSAMGIMNAFPGPVFDALDFKQLKWPGHGVPVDRTFQFIEGEYMKAEEYDAFLHDPSDFLIRTYLPRICGTLAPLKKLPSIPNLLPYYSGLILSMGAGAAVGLTSALESLIQALTAMAKYGMAAGKYAHEMQSLGYPDIHGGGISQAPFDTIGDSLRGTTGIMLDMYRHPDKLIQAMEKLLPTAIEQGLFTAGISGVPIVFIPLHKGAKGFMSLEQFKTFYWPTLHKLMLAFIDHGLVPMPLIEADYTDRLHLITDIPRGKAIYWFERTDIFKAKEILGDRVCLKGNVPSSLLCTGTPDQVKAYCKKLIDVVGKGGGLIVDGDVGIADEARAENVRAMTEAVFEYGVYR
jgi:hypothetical protein